jgi:hypothetical protein
MRMSIKAAVVTAATAALFAPAASALAESTTIVDGTNDVWVTTYDNQGNPTGETLVSDGTSNDDLTKTSVKFAKNLTIKEEFVDLSKQGKDFLPIAELLTNKGDSVVMIGQAYNDGSRWRHTGFLITGQQSGRQVAPSLAAANSRAAAGKCDKLETSVDWSANTFTMSVPATCLGKNVKWVKAHVYSVGQTYNADADTSSDYVDNGHNDQGDYDGSTARIHKG